MRGLQGDRVMMVGYWVGDYVGFQRVPQICIDGIFSGAHTGKVHIDAEFVEELLSACGQLCREHIGHGAGGLELFT